MNNYLRILTNSIVPFMMLGIAVALIIGLIIMFSYVLVWGIFIGVIFWIAASVKEYFFPSTTTESTVVIRGRIIEQKNNSKDPN